MNTQLYLQQTDSRAFLEKNERMLSMRPMETILDSVLQGDCIEVLNTLPEKSVDLIFADPPYNLQLRQTLHRPDMSPVASTVNDWDQFANYEDYDRFTTAWLLACQRVLKDTGTIWVIGSYHNIYRVGSILMDLDFWILNDIVWRKTNPMPNFRGVRFTNAHEILLWAQKKRGAKYTFNYHRMKALNGGSQMPSVWEIPICSGKERIKIDGIKAHSTQKPEALLYRLISASSNSGEVVLDPFFGTGTTGAVAKRLNRRWIGIEQDPINVELARNRINSVPALLITEETCIDANVKNLLKIPFGRLLELGLVQPGQSLYLHGRGIEATTLPNGNIQSGEHVGSIHRVGTALIGAPCNGWINWDYIDNETGLPKSIDCLRQEARRLIALSTSEVSEEDR